MPNFSFSAKEFARTHAGLIPPAPVILRFAYGSGEGPSRYIGHFDSFEAAARFAKDYTIFSSNGKRVLVFFHTLHVATMI